MSSHTPQALADHRARRPRPPAGPEFGLDVVVEAPTDAELYDYLGPQRRWVMVAMHLAFILAGVSVVMFSLRGFWLWPLIAVLAVNVVGSVLALITGQRRRRIDKASHQTLVGEWAPDRYPSVDVFLPTCGEPIALLHNTYRHVTALQWDGALRVLVLDDGDRADVAALARRFGFDYLVRPDRPHSKKAGNLAHAFANTDGDHIVIFDADFCPRPDFLRHLVPYLDGPSVGIVQSPQCFDTTVRMGWLQRTAGATQELFYRWVQPSRDAAGAPICVGTNAVYRRSALAVVGGFAQLDHSEDIHTGINLLRAGFSTRYVPVKLAKGVCPDDVAAFINQQYRWCNGSLTKLSVEQSDAVPRRRLRLAERMCFWAGFLYYVTTALNVFAVHVPAMVMAALYPDAIRPAHYLPFFFGVWVYLVLLPMVSKGRWRFEVLRIQMLYSLCHAVAIAHQLRGRTAGWVPTGTMRGGNQLARTVARLGVGWFGFMLAVSWISVGWDVYTLGLDDLWPMIVFLIGYSYLSVPLIRDLGALLVTGRSQARVSEAIASTLNTRTELGSAA
jgi:cellulose synthase (UDP-forming)